MLMMAQPLAEKHFDSDHTIDLLVVYDDTDWRYAESQEKRDTYAQEVVQSLNLVLKNSNIDNYAYRLAGTYHWAGYKAPNIDGGLTDATWNENIRNKRKETKADIVLFLTENQDSNSGVAVPSANHTDAFACVRLSMAASAYTAAHEIGHILGANHSDSPQEQQPSNHPWAKGYASPEGYMSVLCSMGSCVPIYSGPNSIWKTPEGKEIVMGDATHDNVRMIRSMITHAVHFGDQLDEQRYYASQEEMRFNKEEQPGEVRVASNQFMQIRSKSDWISQVSPTFCSNSDAVVTFTLAANHSGQDRTGSILLSGDAQAKEIKITQTAADINVDCDYGTYSLNANSFVDRSQFVRTFSNTAWQSLYIPFLWRNNDWKNQFDIAELKSVEDAGNRAATLTIVPLTTEDVQANKPYLIRAKKANTYVLDLEHINFYPAATTPVHYTSGNQNFYFTGTYQGVDGQDMYNNGYYGMFDGILTPTDNVNTKLKAFRWYLNVTDKAGKPLTTPLKIKVVEQGGDATGLEEIQTERPVSNIYDLNGRLIKKATESPQDLPVGIYIVNGKKVVY